MTTQQLKIRVTDTTPHQRRTYRMLRRYGIDRRDVNLIIIGMQMGGNGQQH